jgi:hypothetical protein
MRRRLTMEHHKENCLNPFDIRAIPLRVIVNGEPKSVTWGNLCMGCGNTEQTNFSDVFKSKRIKAGAININRKFSDEEIEDFEAFTDIRIKEHVKWNRRSRSIIIEKTSPEISLKTKIRSFGKFYKTVEGYYYGLKLDWDPKLCKKFLASRPTLTQLMMAIMGPKLEWIYSGLEARERNKRIGRIYYMKNSLGLYKSDPKAYLKTLKSETEARNRFMKLVVISAKRKKKKSKKLPMLPLIYA